MLDSILISELFCVIRLISLADIYKSRITKRFCIIETNFIIKRIKFQTYDTYYKPPDCFTWHEIVNSVVVNLQNFHQNETLLY